MMGWLKAMAMSALMIFLVGGIVVGFTCLITWAEKRGRDLEMFVVIVIGVMWIVFTFVLHKTR